MASQYPTYDLRISSTVLEVVKRTCVIIQSPALDRRVHRYKTRPPGSERLKNRVRLPQICQLAASPTSFGAL
jgi:hypothetical protein